MSDLIKLKPSKDNIFYTVHHPVDDTLLLNDDGSLMTIELLSPHSDQFKHNQLKQLAKQVELAASTPEYDLDVEAITAASCEVLAEATVSWTITFDGEKPDCTSHKAHEIYSEIHWLRYQIEAVIAHSMVSL